MHSDFFRFVVGFWWLIFPIFGMGMGVLGMVQRHSRANRAIEIMKSYADQGKEPPPELLAALREPEISTAYRKRGGSWIPVFLFAALAIAFTYMGWSQQSGTDDSVGLYFVAIIMAGLFLGFLIQTLTRLRDPRDRMPSP